MRAALESIAYQVRDVIDVMSRASGLPLTHIYGDGGMVGNRFLMQFVADVCRLTVEASEVPALSALGAAQAGMLGMGIYKDLEALHALPLPMVRCTPSELAAPFENWYQSWLVAVQRVL